MSYGFDDDLDPMDTVEAYHLIEERAENDRLEKRIAALEAEVAERDRDIERLTDLLREQDA